MPARSRMLVRRLHVRYTSPGHRMAMGCVVTDQRQNTIPENRQQRCASVWNGGHEGSTWIGAAAATNTSRAFSAVDGGCCAGGRLSDATTRRHRLRRRKRESLVTLCNTCSAVPRSCHDEESPDGHALGQSRASTRSPSQLVFG